MPRGDPLSPTLPTDWLQRIGPFGTHPFALLGIMPIAVRPLLGEGRSTAVAGPTGESA